jgi:hypothetical protein
MTSTAVTTRKCASASEVALLVASFMPSFSLNLGTPYRCAKPRKIVRFDLEHPTMRIRLIRVPTLANIDLVNVE